MQEQRSEPTVISLDNNNSVQILSQYVELAQQKGAYLLNEAELLKRAMDVLVNNVPDRELNQSTCKQLLVQGVQKGQRHGAYTLNDAALLSKVVQFIASSLQANESSEASSQNPQVAVEHVPQESGDDLNDLHDLAEPIPLKPKEV